MSTDVRDFSKVKTAKAFSLLSVGNAIFDARSESSVILVIRKIGERLILASFSPSYYGVIKLKKIFPSTYLWSKENDALMDEDDQIPSWWNSDQLSVSKDPGKELLDLAAKYSSVPVWSDFLGNFKSYVDEEDFSSKHQKLIEYLVDVISASSSNAVALLHLFDKTKDFPDFDRLVIAELVLLVLGYRAEEKTPTPFTSLFESFYQMNG